MDRLGPSVRENFNTTIDEIVHQAAALIGDPLFPAWVAEGLAEYFCAMQTTPGNLSFRNTTPQVRRSTRRKRSRQRGGVRICTA